MNARLNIGLNYFFTSHFAATFVLADIVSYNDPNPASGEYNDDLRVNINLF